MLNFGEAQAPTLIAEEAMSLFHQIRNFHPNTQYVAYYLEYLAFHIREPLLVPALQWLIKNKIVGQKFIDFVQEDCSRSGLELIRQLTMRIEKDKHFRRLHRKDVR